MSDPAASVPSLAAAAYKRSVPNVERHVPRATLLAQLSSSTSPLTWVVGLPGAGKTSLVAHHAHAARTQRRVLWYRVDEHDDDPAAAFAAWREDSGQNELPQYSPEHGGDVDDFALGFFSALAGSGPVLLVVDDCHRVSDHAALYRALAAVVPVAERFGDRVRVVCVSRRPPPALFAPLLVSGQLAVVDRLRLSADEARAIAAAAGGVDVDVEVADGWLALVLALARSSHSDVSRATLAERADVGSFLAEELLRSLPVAHRARLRQLAELPEIPIRLPGPRGRAALVPDEIARLLHTLAAQRWFVDVTAAHHWRLHDLLRDALREKNARDDAPAALNAARRLLADAVKDVLPEAALGLAIDADDLDMAAALLRAHGDGWLRAGRHRALLDYLAPIPGADDVDDAFALWRAQAELPLFPERARPRFALAREAARRDGDARTAYVAWCGQVASYVVQWGAVHGLADLVDDLEAMTRELGPPPGELAFRTAADALTALMYGRAEDPRIRAYADVTARALDHVHDDDARITAAAQLLIYRLWWAGDFPGGRALYESYDAFVDDDTSRLAPLSRLVWWSCASIVDWQCGSKDVCYQKVERGLQLSSTSGVRVRDFFLLTQGIFCALSNEEWARAERYLAMLAHTEREHMRLDAMVHHFFRSWYALSRGDPRTALAHAETAWPMAEALGSMFHKVIVLSALAPACVACGDLDGAERAYREQLALAKAANNPTFSFIAFCAGAEIARAKGDDDALARQVQRMLMVKHLGGFHTGCGWRTPMMQAVLAFALDHDLGADVALAWIDEKHIPPPHPVPARWPVRLRIEARTGLVVSRGGDVVDGGTAQGQRLLALLVVHGGRATLAQLADVLWPDAEGDKAQSALKVALHRLRKWIGADAIVVDAGSVALGNGVDVDVFAADFDGDADLVLAGIDVDAGPVRQRLRRRHPS